MYSYSVNPIIFIFSRGFGRGKEEKLESKNSLVSVLVLDSQPVVNSFLTNSFVIEPARERERENHYYWNQFKRLLSFTTLFMMQS